MTPLWCCLFLQVLSCAYRGLGTLVRLERLPWVLGNWYATCFPGVTRCLQIMFYLDVMIGKPHLNLLAQDLFVIPSSLHHGSSNNVTPPKIDSSWSSQWYTIYTGLNWFGEGAQWCSGKSSRLQPLRPPGWAIHVGKLVVTCDAWWFTVQYALASSTCELPVAIWPWLLNAT